MNEEKDGYQQFISGNSGLIGNTDGWVDLQSLYPNNTLEYVNPFNQYSSYLRKYDQNTDVTIKAEIVFGDILKLDFYVEKELDGLSFLEEQNVLVALKGQDKTNFANNPSLFFMRILKAKNLDPYIQQNEKRSTAFDSFSVQSFIAKHKTR